MSFKTYPTNLKTKKSLLTHDHSRQGEEERRHKINNNKIKREIIIRKTMSQFVF